MKTDTETTVDAEVETPPPEAPETPEAKPGVPQGSPEADLIDVPEPEQLTITPEGKATEVDKEPADDDKDQRRRPPRKGRDLMERVSQLTRARHEAEEREAAALAKLDLQEAELRELREKAKAAPATPAAKAETPLTEEQLREKKKAALDAADFDAYDRYTDQLLEIKLQRAIPKAERKPEPAAAEDATAPKINPHAEAWLKSNTWFDAPEHKALRSEVIRVEKRLREEEGLPFGAGLYKRLNEELAKLPEFDPVLGEVEEVVDDPPPARNERQPAGPRVVGPGREPPPPARPPETPGRLTDYDKATMRRFGLDPNNPQQRAAYLKRKS